MLDEHADRSRDKSLNRWLTRIPRKVEIGTGTHGGIGTYQKQRVNNRIDDPHGTTENVFRHKFESTDH